MISTSSPFFTSVEGTAWKLIDFSKSDITIEIKDNDKPLQKENETTFVPMLDNGSYSASIVDGDRNITEFQFSIRNILLMNGTEILKGFSEIEIDNDKVFSPTKCSFTVKKDGSTFYLDIDRSEVKLNNEKYYSYNLANEDIDRLEYRAHKITMLSLSIEAYTIKSSGIFWTDLYIEKYNEKFERIMNQLLFEYK